jgi:hypothetical protein
VVVVTVTVKMLLPQGELERSTKPTMKLSENKWENNRMLDLQNTKWKC